MSKKMLKKLWTDKDLREAVREFDSRWFKFSKKKKAQLVGIRFSSFKEPLMGQTTRRWDRDKNGKKINPKFIIEINKQYQDCRRIWGMTLLHELVHFKIWDKDPSSLYCGSRMFNREMKRLARIGALSYFW